MGNWKVAGEPSGVGADGGEVEVCEPAPRDPDAMLELESLALPTVALAFTGAAAAARRRRSRSAAALEAPK